MSLQGQLIRGYKYYLQRDVNGNLPKGIAEDISKMKDVNYYLDFLKDREEEKVNKTLLLIRHSKRSGRRETFDNALKILNSDELKKKVKKGAE